VRAAAAIACWVRRWPARVAIVVWAGLSLIVGATLMVGHWSTLPTPAADDSELRAALASLRPSSADASWLAVHVLYSKCRCSQRVIDHLVTTDRPADLDETVLLAGADEGLERRVRDAGFHVVVVEPRELATRFHVESAPLFVVLDSHDAVRYAGGYTDRRQGYAVLDLDILNALRQGRPASRLPLFGCGVTKELQQLLDPLGVKYD
jgi:hypothetical protein